MNNKLIVEAGQNSQAGIKEQNEDCCGIRIPDEMDLIHKGIVAITADGVGSSEAAKEASEYCVQGFISDYFSTPMSWSVKTAGERIIRSLNSWLYSQGQRRYASQLSLASTLAVLVLKSTTAHLFHVGDSRIYLIRSGSIRCLTKDHRLTIDHNKTYLARAMGGENEVNFDYQSLPVELNDRFILTSDGVHEFLCKEQLLASVLSSDNPETIAENIIDSALKVGSDDNLTCQVLLVKQLPNQNENEYYRELTSLPFPPPLDPGMELDGYHIIKELHSSVTIQVYLAEDIESGETVVIKTPSVNFEDDPAYIDRFLHEVWVGRRISSPHVFKVFQLKRKRSCIYYVTEFLEGQSLAQWILDNPKPDLGQVRDIVDQVIKGLRAFHRREMVHQDIKPDNIMIDKHGVTKIIDFGSTQVAGLKEIYTPIEQHHLDGTANYIAPELFEGFEGTPHSDMYSLGITVYEILSNGHFPYGDTEETKPHKHYVYTSVRKHNSDIPVWMDGAIQKAVQKDPDRRYESYSEFQYDLSNPNPAFMKTTAPLIERNPLGFWRGLSIIMIAVNLLLLFLIGR
ncbi:serine/threonine-protein kinase StkP [Mariprofundus micogutta]|uniref:Serine/threonine-protein kinase StkP n=1 Tax=Mariprofundus micogutta TaxID=1921010 RepID=A0A1L8CQF6_9PROT|nr:bifunctional protein-serine/threonine kinase/phosphatase [Mariprofundus micogutta]GAV21123.1 serine/threonine-protein kinase StkP [Mariprofundus micogutta]